MGFEDEEREDGPPPIGPGPPGPLGFFEDNVFFNKIGASVLSAETQEALDLPLGSADYAISRETQILLKKSLAVSVVLQQDLIQRNDDAASNIAHLLDSPYLEGCRRPTYPSHPEYWTELDYVARCQIQRQNCGATKFAEDVWSLPDMLKKTTLNFATDAVHDEPPGFWQSKFLIDYVFGSSSYELDQNIIQKRVDIEFLLGPASVISEVLH